MNCSISIESQKKLRKKIAHDILEAASANQIFDLKALTKNIYDLIKGSTDDHNQALDYARLVPYMVDNLQAADSNIKKAFLESGIDYRNFSQLVTDSLNEESGLKAIEKFLDLRNDETIKKELKLLNDKTETSTSQLKLDFDTPPSLNPGDTVRVLSGKGGVSKIKIDRGDKVLLEDGRQVLKTNLEFVPEEPKAEKKENEKTVLDIFEDLIREASGKTTAVLGQSNSFPTQQLLLDKLKDGTYDPVLAREIFEKWKEYKSVPGYPNLSPKQINIIEEAISKLESKTQEKAPQQEVPKQEVPEKKSEAPKPPVQRVNPLQRLSNKIREIIYNGFNAIAPTFFADAVFETRYGKDAAEQKANRIPIENTKFYFGVKRNLINMLTKAHVNMDSSQLMINGTKGVYLTAVPASSLEQTPYIAETLQKDPRAVVMVLTNQYGEHILFNEKYEPVLDGGKPAFYLMRNVDDIIDTNGKVNESKLYTVAKALQTVADISAEEAKARVLLEAQRIKNVRDHLEKNPADSVQFKINGGTLGYIELSSTKLTPLKDVKEDLKFEMADEATSSDEKGIRKGYTYVTVQDLYGQWIEVERPGLAETQHVNTVFDLLFENITTNTGKPLLYSQRRKLLRNFINLSDDDKRIVLSKDEEDPYKYNLLINGNIIDLSSQESIAAAKDTLTIMFNQKNKADFYDYKMNINKDILNEIIDKPILTKAEDGSITLTTEKILYREFLNENNFSVQTKELASDGKLRRTNAYFTFELTEAGEETLYPQAETEQKQAEKSQKNDERIEQLKKDIPTENSGDFIDSLLDELNKNKKQKGLNKGVTAEQINAAREWYEKSPLNNYISFEAMFHAVNQSNGSSVASFAMNGIILYKGSDFTDLYHEAWHAFSQAFMTIEEKTAIYNEVRKKNGSFTDYNGRRQSFASANDKQVEEYLAEEFRTYMLSGGKKVQKDSPAQNSFFRKIWNALKILFGKSTIKDMTLHLKEDATIMELFEKLKVGEISEYSFSSQNVMFGTLNQGITAKETPLEGATELNYDNSKVVTEMVDSFIADYIDIANARLTAPERDRYNYIQSQLSRTDLPLNNILNPDGSVKEPGKKQLEAELAALKTKSTYQNTGRITKDPVMLVTAYKYAKFRFEELITKHLDDAEKETNVDTKARILRNIEVLKFARDHFGTFDIESDKKVEPKENETDEERTLRKRNNAVLILQANAPANGDVVTDVIGYHMMKTKLFGDSIMSDIEDLDANEQFVKSQRAFDRNGNESSLKEMASAEIIFLLKTLPDIQKDGTITKNRFDVNQRVPFQAVWNRLARTLENTPDLTEMYKKLEAESKIYAPIKVLIDKMGDPSITSNSTEMGLWHNFRQTFGKARVPLFQMTVTSSRDFEGNVSYTHTAGEAFNSDFIVGKNWQAEFTAAIPSDSNYILRDENGNNYLDVVKLMQNFTADSVKKDPFTFYHAIGMKLTDVPEIREALSGSEKLKYSPIYLFNKIKQLTADKETITRFDQFTSDSANKYRDLQILESKYSDVFSNFMVTNAEGNTQFEHTLNNTLTIIVNSINNLTDEPGKSAYQKLLDTPHLAHLGLDKNPFSEASIWMRSMFYLEDSDKGTARFGTRKQKPDGSYVTLKLVNLSGVLMKHEIQQKEDEGYIEEEGDGISSSGADEYSKFIMDIHLSYDGVHEFMRHADKGTSFAVKIDGPVAGNRVSNENYVPIKHFADGKEYKETTSSLLLPHIIAEMKRIRIMKNLAKSNIENYDFNYVQEGQKFATFDNVLTKKTKEKLMRIVESSKDISNESSKGINKAIAEVKGLMEDIQKDIDAYFELQYQNNKVLFDDASFISKSILTDMGKKENGIAPDKKQEAFIRSYTHNSWIHNLESLAIIYGDPAQYNMAKEEFHKRNAGAGSTGTTYATDSITQNYINNVLYSTSYAAKNAEALGIKEQHMFTGRMHTAIIEDMNVQSAYLEEYEKAGVNVDGYDKQNEGDGQGWITFDAYRQLKTAEGTWSDAHEELFKKIVNLKEGEEIDPKKINKFFPVIKGQYWGPLQTDHLPVTAFHKFSLFPLIPSVIKGKKLEALHNRMVKENISYATFESGSKIGNITKGFETKDYIDENGEAQTMMVRKFDKAYKDQKTGELVDGLTDFSIEGEVFTKNTIHLEYFKNQLEIHDERKGSVVFSTQLRKLVEDGLMKNGVPMDFMKSEDDASKRIAEWNKLKTEKAKEDKSPYYKLLKTYESNLNKLTDFYKQKLLNEINWTQGMLEGTEQKDMKSLMDMVQKELTRQDLGQHSIDFIQIAPDGSLKWDLSLSLNVEKIEKLLNAMMVKKLIKQKVNGEGLIQVAVTFMEEMNAERRFTNATEEELATLGSNTLPTYRPQYDADGNQLTTTAMKVKIALAGDFLKLLEARHLDGKKIKTRKRLNEMIQDEEWLQENRRLITMTAVRIPVQGLNSMEFMEVYEFLDASAGSVIVPPTEVVTKSGADFDVDKMTVMMPNITVINGNVELYRSDVKATDTKENLETQREQLRVERDQIRKKYDDIFDRKDIEKEFAFTPEQTDRLTRLSEELNTLKEQIEEKKAQKKVLYKSYKGNKLKEVVEQYNNSITELYEQKNKLYEERKELITSSKSEVIEKLTKEQQDLLEPIERNLTRVQREINSFSQKGIENDLISNIAEILALPENFIPLVTPNGTGILDPISDELKDSAMAFNPLDNAHNEGRRKKLVKGKMKDVISPTRILEINYNLYKHASNNIGKQTLGLGAVDNTYNTLFNRIGAYMNVYTADLATYEDIKRRYDNKERITPEEKSILDKFTKQTILLNHNTIKQGTEDAISLSHTEDAVGKNSISNVVNQLINGWVDIAKDAWIFNIQGNKEVSPTLLFMIQAGVPITEAVYFASNPLVRDYVKKQKLAKSLFGKALDASVVDANYFRNHARDKVLTTREYGFGLASVDNTKLKDITNRYLESRINNKIKFDAEDLKTRAIDKNHVIDEVDRAVFLHFLQLEEMTKAVRDVKMRTNVDTSRDVSLFEAQDRLTMLDELRRDGRIPADLVEKIEKESPIGSFFIQDFQIKLLGDAFPLRNHKVLNDYLQENMTNDLQDDTYGTRETAVVNWKSDLINYIFQNELRYFDIEKMDYFWGRPIVGDPGIVKLQNLKHGAFMKDGSLYVDIAELKKQFKNKTFSSHAYNKDTGLATVSNRTFENEQEYMHFVATRETLRYTKPLTSLINSKKFINTGNQVRKNLKRFENESKDNYQKRLINTTYEEYLKDLALTKTYNHVHLFKSNDSFANEFIRIKKAYPELVNTFSIMNALSFRESAGLRNLIVNESQMDADQLNVFHENLEHLSNPAKIKEILPDATSQDINEITEFFDMFDIVAFLQSGMNVKSSYAMTPFVSQTKMLTILEEPLKNFMTLLDSKSQKGIELRENLLGNFTRKWRNQNKKENRSSRIRGKYYNSNVSLMDSSTISRLDAKEEPVKTQYFAPTAFLQEETADDLEFVKGDKIINEDDLSSFNKYISKSKNLPKEFFTPSTRFREFYNSNTGKRENAPQTAKWLLNSYKLYDLVDQETGEYYIFNVDLSTGHQYTVLKNETQPTATVPGFQGYKGGFEATGKGTPQGDGKDKAMRQVATSSIVEMKSDKRASSSMTTLDTVGTDNDYSYEKDRYVGSSYNGTLPAFSGVGVMSNFGTTVMLARNGTLANTPLSNETKRLIKIANQQGVTFVVGDMPGVDSQFIDYLQEIGAKFTIYHTGSTSRIQVKQSTKPSTSVKPNVILPIGTSGSGKSTFIKSLPQENLVVISPDDMRVEFTGDINNKSKDKEIYEEAAKRAVAAIEQGNQVVFDTTNLTKDKRRPFIEAIKKAIPNAIIQYKLMPLNAELAKQRIKAQIARGENRADVSDETIDRHAASYKQMLEDIKYEGITDYDDTVSQSAEQSTEQITFPTSITYGSSKLGPASAKTLVEQHPDKTFVYNYAMLSQEGGNTGDHAIHGAGPNTFGIPSLRRYSALDSRTDKYSEQPTILRDGEDGRIHPSVKKAIDAAISDLKEIQKSSQLVFPTGGFGQEMLLKSKGDRAFAPQTFLYLSKQLYENFGYLNPQYLNTKTGRARVQVGQPITDVEIKELNDQAVMDFIKLCKS